MRLTFLAVALWLVCAATAQAAAPANDAYANAATLTVGAAVTGDTVDATQEAGEPTPFPLTFPGVSCDPTQFGTCAGSVWYTFTAPSTGTFALTDCDWATDFPTVIAVYSGDGLASSKSAASGSFTAPCTTAGTNVVPNVQFSATQGTTYHVQVGGVFGDSGVFGLRVYPAASPPASPPVDTLVDANASLVPRQAGYTQPVHSGVRRSASFAFYARLNDATFECSLDGAPFSACTSPVAYDDITSGRHEFAVRAAVGQGVDPTPARQIFTVDAAPPDTLVGADRYPAAVPTGAATFACSTDGLAGACPFPSSLCAGQHTVTATAISPAGAVDVTQASGTFTGGGGTCAAPSLIDDDVDVDSVGATFAQLNVTVTAAGLPVTARLDYGPTTSYGSSVEGFGNQFNDYVRLPRLRYLTPATTYHYRVTLTDSAGSTSTDDLTFTTKAAPAVLPTVTTGTPVFVGRHAMRVPLTLTDPLGSDLRWGVVVSQSGQPDVEIDGPFDTDEAGPVSVSVVDLDANAQLQVRGIVTGPETVQGNSVSITTPAPPAPQPTPTAPAGSPAPTASPSPTPAASPSPSPSPKPAAFKLRRANVRVGKVARRAGTIAVRLRGVPAGTRVVVVAKLGGKRLGRGAGKRKAVVRLSHKARRTLRGNRSRKLRLTVTAAPPGGTTSAVTISQRLKKPR